MKNTEQVLELVREERRRQDKKWGYPQKNTPFEWISILTEEVGELAQATNDAFMGGKGTCDMTKVRTEAVQVAAVAVSILEHLGWPALRCADDRDAAAPGPMTAGMSCAELNDHAARVNALMGQAGVVLGIPAEEWERAKEYLDDITDTYERVPGCGIALSLTIYPLRDRYLQGERTRGLFDEIMELDV